MNLARLALVALIVLASGLIASCSRAVAQDDQKMVRLAKLTIDAAHLSAYKAALQEEIEDSLRLEPGVLTLYAVSEQSRPTHFTLLEIYANRAAYEQHIKSPHFLKYETSTAKMVLSLELIDTTPLIPEMQVSSR